MPNTSLKIIIFDGSFKTTAFINRLVKGLSQNHQVFILGFNNKIDIKFDEVTYVDLGSAQYFFNLILQSKWLAVKRLIKTGDFSSFFKTVKHILTLNKKQLQQDNFNTALDLINPDLIHVQWQSLIPWCEEALEKEDYPFIISQRGYQSNVLPFVNNNNFTYLKTWYPKFKGFHSVSRAISKTGDKIYTSPSKIDKVVYSGFDFSTLLFTKSYQKQKSLRLLSVGRPHWKKGYSDALKALKLVKAANIPFNYTIIGVENKNEELLYFINEFDLHQEVTLLPKVSQQKVYDYMRESQVFLLPSIEEGIANVVIEAMALGTPVISTNCGGMTELIEHDKTGWLVPVRNHQAMAQAIINFFKMPLSQIESIRLSARKKVEQQHQQQQMIKGMEELYSLVLNRFVSTNE